MHRSCLSQLQQPHNKQVAMMNTQEEQQHTPCELLLLCELVYLPVASYFRALVHVLPLTDLETSLSHFICRLAQRPLCFEQLVFCVLQRFPRLSCLVLLVQQRQVLRLGLGLRILVSVRLRVLSLADRVRQMYDLISQGSVKHMNDPHVSRAVGRRSNHLPLV